MPDLDVQPDQPQVAVIDYGSQYSRLIVRKIRELGFFSQLYQPGELSEFANVDGLILSGGPSSIETSETRGIELQKVLDSNLPVLGICYGMQMLIDETGGEVRAQTGREYGPASVEIPGEDTLFEGVGPETSVWMSHSDSAVQIPENARVIARGESGNPVGLQWPNNTFGVQFHPEVSHTRDGKTILSNFLSLLPVDSNFTITHYRDLLSEEIKRTADGREVVCGVSGGVDSTVLAVLLTNSGVDTHFIFVDSGLLRHGEAAEVQGQFQELGIEIDVVDASDQFLDELEGVSDPEEKRNRIGRTFLDVFFEHAGSVDLLAQGSLYPDVIESASNESDASTIKTHHNRIEEVQMLEQEDRILEPLRRLFKDEVRELGKTLDIPDRILGRHPFPGPGLAIRIPGPVTRGRLKTVRKADRVLIETLKESGWYDRCWQTFCVLLPIKSVGVKGDARSYEHPLVIRSVSSEDGMTADWSRLPDDVLEMISSRILNQVKGINRVLYDISTKPPASIEWE